MTKLEAGRYGGFRDAGGYTPQDIRYTQKGDVIYAILLGWPGGGARVTLQSFAKGNLDSDLTIAHVTMLGSERAIRWEQGEVGLTFATPDEHIDDLAVVFKIELSGGS